MEKELLEIGDKIKRFEIIKEIDTIYEIASVTKTLAKTVYGHTFYRKLNYNTSKPKENYVAEVRRKDIYNSGLGKRFFLIE